jgi:hypothetical protein
MADEPMKIPGPDHPISIDANRSRVVVIVAGYVVADTREALTLGEAHYCVTASVRLQVETDKFLDQEVDEQPPANGQLAAERVQRIGGKRRHGEVGENFHEPSFL